MDREAVRVSYRPQVVEILFVGESPPANGDFFYVSSAMTSHMAHVFETISTTRFASSSEFLDFFKAKGCYLDDISHDPVDHLARAERKRALGHCVDSFGARLAYYDPKLVVAILKSIETYVNRAAESAHIICPVHAVPFPGQGHQRRFAAELLQILRPFYGFA